MNHFRRWGAAYVLLVLFIGSWLGQFVFQVLVGGENLGQFFSATFENWQSEWLQLFVQAVLLLGMKHLLFKADAEDMEQVQASLDRIEQAVSK